MRYADCPKCGRRCEASGMIDVEGVRAAVFQCDECLVAVEMFGEPVEVALTFAVDAEGRVFDPAAQEGSNAPWEDGGASV